MDRRYSGSRWRVLNAIREVEELADRKILDGEKIISPQQGKDGVDIYLSTSSATSSGNNSSKRSSAVFPCQKGMISSFSSLFSPSVIRAL